MINGMNDGLSSNMKMYLPSVKRTGKLRIYISEEQQMLREAYNAFFSPQPDMEVVGSSGDIATTSLGTIAATLKPDVMLLGFKILQPTTVEKLESIRENYPSVALVVLSAYYDVKGIKALREFSRGGAVGCAYLLKHNVDTVEQLTQVIYSVAEGFIIVDPAVMEGLIATAEAKAALLKELTPRELEVLSWMAKGYRDNTIAEILCLEPKTVERHINSIYSKLGGSLEFKHARVHAITQYLKATGLLPTDGLDEN